MPHNRMDLLHHVATAGAQYTLVTHSMSAPNTKRMQASIHASMAVSPSAFGVFGVTVLKMLTSTRKRVTRSAILPGITSIGMRKEIQDTMTNRPGCRVG